MLINQIVDELNEKIKGTDLMACADEHNFQVLVRGTSRAVVNIPLPAYYLSQCYINLLTPNVGASNGLRRTIDKTIRKILATPSSKLLAEEKYIVAPDGLDSSHGQQLLSTDGMDRIFFAAKNKSLKQSFTNDELQNIIDQNVCLGISWLAPVIYQYKKLVE